MPRTMVFFATGMGALMVLGLLTMAGFVALIVVLIVVGAQAEKKRREALQAWCAARGLRFNGAKDPGFDDRFPAFKCLHQGDGRYAQYQMTGELGGRPCTCFIFHYETHSTDSKGHSETHHWYISGAAVRSDVLLEDLLIRPENLLDKIAGAVGFDDIDFESAEFSRAFFVKAPNRKWAYDVIHARTMEFLLAQPRHGIELHGAFAMAFKGGHMKPADFEVAAGLVNGVLDRLPPYVIQQQKEAQARLRGV